MKKFINSKKELIRAISVLAAIMAFILILGYVIKVLPQKPDYIVTLNYYTLNDTFTVPISYGIKYKKGKLSEQKGLIKAVFDRLSKPDNAYNKVIYSPVEDWELNNIIVDGDKLTLWLKSKQKYKARGTSYDNNLLHSLISTYDTVPDTKRLSLVFLDTDDNILSLGGGLDTSNIDLSDKKNFLYANIIQRYPKISGNKSDFDIKRFIPQVLLDNTRTNYVKVYLLDKRLNLLVPVDIMVIADEDPDEVILKTLSTGASWLLDEYGSVKKQYRIKAYNAVYGELEFFVSPLSGVKINKAKRLGGRVDVDIDPAFVPLYSRSKDYNRFIEALTHSYADSYSDMFEVKYFYITMNGTIPSIKGWEYSADKPMILKKHINLMDDMLWPIKK